MLAVELAAVLGVKMEMITVGGRACACGLDGRSAEEKIEMVRKVRGVSRLRERRRKPASRKKEDGMEAKPTLDSAAEATPESQRQPEERLKEPQWDCPADGR